MSTSNLAQIAADLGHAAGPGARGIEAEVVAKGRQRVEVGHALGSPGPGARQLMRARGSEPVLAPAQVPLGQVLDRGAGEAADDGVAVALGQQR